MASNAPTSYGAAGTAPPLRQLWQVPTFLLGLLALAGVWVARPLWQTTPCRDEDRTLAAVRRHLNERDFDRAVADGEQALAQAHGPAHHGEAHFLLGSAHVGLAEKAAPPDGRDSWRRARYHLEQAEALGVPEADAPRLTYRLGKAWAHTDQEPRRVIDYLSASVEAGAGDATDAARGYALLADAHLRLPEPDLAAALAANEKLLQQPIVSEEVLAPARLLRGEMLHRLGRDAEARAAWKNVGAHAPPALAAQARLLRARSLEADAQWAEAADAWREALADRRSPPRDRHVVLYHLGLCLRNTDQKAEAAPAWEECVRLNAPGDEVPAAALGLAELRARGDAPAAALEPFERAVRDVKAPADWVNALVTLERARDAFELGCRACREAEAHEPAVRLARLYERLAVPGRAQELRGLAAEAWARDRQEQAGRAKPDGARALLAEAAGLLVRAGEAHEQSAALRAAPGERAESLWRAGQLYAEGRDFKRAVAAYDGFLREAQRPEALQAGTYARRLGEAWYRLAEARRALHDEPAALAAFRECLKWPGRYGYRARYQLAIAEKVRGKLDDAKEMLEQNLALLRRESLEERDPEAKEKTLFALGDVYFERRELKGELAKAITTLEGALEQFAASPDALFARYQLAESYRLLADQLSQSLGPQERLSVEARLRIEQEVAHHRERAVANYEELSRLLLAKPARNQDEDSLLVYASFTTADCRFLLGDYEGAGRAYEALAQRYKGRVEQFNALAGVVRCYSVPGSPSPEKARKALEEVRAGLDSLDPPTRQEFERWLKAFE
jgi:hypothetical protein